MDTASFTTTFEVDRPAREVFDAIVDVRSWWEGEFVGEPLTLGDEFTYQYSDLHWCAMRVTRLEPTTTVAWEVTDSRIEFTQIKDEWTGTVIRFDIEPTTAGSRLTFTHDGLVPADQCYHECSNAWTAIVQDGLRHRILSGP